MKDDVEQQATGFPTGHLSDAKIQELNEIRKKIKSRARRTVDPYGSGFDAVMRTDDGGFIKKKPEVEERYREKIKSRARRTVDPLGTGFDAFMQSSDDGGFFNTDEEDLRDWLDWAERFTTILSLVSQRVSLAIASAGFAIAGANMVGTDRGGSLGLASLAVAGVFGVWYAAVTASGAKRR
jgi:hypothetical protein